MAFCDNTANGLDDGMRESDISNEVLKKIYAICTMSLRGDVILESRADISFVLRNSSGMKAINRKLFYFNRDNHSRDSIFNETRCNFFVGSASLNFAFHFISLGFLILTVFVSSRVLLYQLIAYSRCVFTGH